MPCTDVQLILEKLNIRGGLNQGFHIRIAPHLFKIGSKSVIHGDEKTVDTNCEITVLCVFLNHLYVAL